MLISLNLDTIDRNHTEGKNVSAPTGLSEIYVGEIGQRPIDATCRLAKEQQIARSANAFSAITSMLADQFGSPLTRDFPIPECNIGNPIGTGEWRYLYVLFEGRNRPVCFRPWTTIGELVEQLAGPAPPPDFY
ncbi:MAG: hypothetical protein KW804_01740 [Candidatus Doudnabacteria bacterium]|nr:hypothetical protein [Candidatus Doudnabacteria bacterium]